MTLKIHRTSMFTPIQLPNGAEIIAKLQLNLPSVYDARWVVCCKYHSDTPMPYVTWIVDEEGNAESGNYFQTLKAAVRDWEDRAGIND